MTSEVSAHRCSQEENRCAMHGNTDADILKAIECRSKLYASKYKMLRPGFKLGLSSNSKNLRDLITRLHVKEKRFLRERLASQWSCIEFCGSCVRFSVYRACHLRSPPLPSSKAYETFTKSACICCAFLDDARRSHTTTSSRERMASCHAIVALTSVTGR